MALKSFTGNIVGQCVLLLTVFFVVSVHAEGPAVSGINAKVEGFGGIVNTDVEGMDDGAWGGAASLSFPLFHFMGFQIDGLGGEFAEQDVAAVGVHLFWRDPEVALFGAIYSYTDMDFAEFERAGVEGELYLNRLTFKATVGWQGGHNVDDSAWGGGSMSYYFLENFLLQIGGQGGSDHVLGTVKAEWQPAFSILPGLTVFANGGIGDEDYSHGIFGLRYYFGSKKSLIKRHRQDDPENGLLDGLGLNGKPTPPPLPPPPQPPSSCD